ncbi:MAG TPA: M23 family metallopeptidase [Pyrinomonadaceae bacterium]|nr:M23 family metallopeptidase [Pyrinomonadaceae bacterium]
MKLPYLLLLAIGAILIVTPQPALAQKLSAVPIDLEVPLAPTPVRANRKVHLFYELHLTNFRSKSLELTRLDVIEDGADNPPLVTYKDAELVTVIARPGNSEVPDKRIIGGGTRAIVFIQITVNNEAGVPRALRHRLFFKPDEPDSSGEERVIDGAIVVVHRAAPLVISSPLRGKSWVALSALSNTNSHRRTLVVVNGKARIAQRFATDWTRIGADGQAFRGDPSQNANWSAYGAEILAVADARVVDLRDGIPENDPTADKKAVPITLETVAGNYIILDLGAGHFAFYAHLQPNSFRVEVGAKVRRGQTLALLGNSGQADAPHLHFHVTDGNSPLGAEGVPYVFESFELFGVLPSKKVLVNGEGWKPGPAKPETRRREMPTEDTIVGFP